jgi:hypothetical protein
LDEKIRNANLKQIIKVHPSLLLNKICSG